MTTQYTCPKCGSVSQTGTSLCACGGKRLGRDNSENGGKSGGESGGESSGGERFSGGAQNAKGFEDKGLSGEVPNSKYPGSTSNIEKTLPASNIEKTLPASNIEKTLPAPNMEKTLPAGRNLEDFSVPPSGMQKPYLYDSRFPNESRRVNDRPNNGFDPLPPKQEALNTVRDQAMHSLVGQVLDNQYQILSKIGQGGMSVVYKARHNMLRKIVAIKTMLPHLVQHPQSLQRFQQEAQAASNIVHTNVITIYNFGITPEGQPYLVMDYLEGVSLAELITQEKFLKVDRATNIFLQVANALAHAHSKGVIHRDLKPSNIILIEQGEKKDIVQIVDFGIAKMLPQDGEEAMNLTQTGEVFGSPLYMSPEQCKGEKLDHRADIYSLGCLMYETLTGKPPLYGDNTLEVLYRHINEMPGHMSSKEHPISPKLEAIVFKALAKLPSNRYQSMDELEKDLNSFQKTQQFSVISFLKSRWELSRLKRLPQTKRDKAAALAITLSCLVTFSALLYPVVNFWNLPNSSITKAPMLLDDDRLPQTSIGNEIEYRISGLALQQADDYLSGKSRVEVPDHLLAALMRQGKAYKDEGNLADALKVFTKAAEFSTKQNGLQSFPTWHALIEKADVAYDMGIWNEAEEPYRVILDALRLTPGQEERSPFYAARLGNCYWYEHNYGLAKLNYRAAINIWSKLYDSRSKKGNKVINGPSKEDAFAYALALTRLAMIDQQELNSSSSFLSAQDKAVALKEAPENLYTALSLWRLVQPGSKNEGICELQLAEAIESNAEIDLSRNPVFGDTQDADSDKNVEKLLQRGAETLERSCGEDDPYHAIALLRLAAHWWRTGKYQQALAERWRACCALSESAKSRKDPVKPAAGRLH